MSEKMQPLGEVRKTGRGFEIIEFEDCSGEKCSLQQSSLANYEKPGTSAIWIGCSDANPLILASQAHKFGVKTTEMTGWVPYPVPDDVLMHTRAQLDREQVAALIAHLQNWLDKDTFEL